MLGYSRNYFFKYLPWRINIDIHRSSQNSRDGLNCLPCGDSKFYPRALAAFKRHGKDADMITLL